MIKMVTVTRAGGSMLDIDENEEILINSGKILEIITSSVEDVGNSKIIFDNDKIVHVVESQKELKKIINS